MNILKGPAARTAFPNGGSDAIERVVASGVQVKENRFSVQGRTLHMRIGTRYGLHELPTLFLASSFHLSPLLFTKNDARSIGQLPGGRLFVQCRQCRMRLDV